VPTYRQQVAAILKTKPSSKKELIQSEERTGTNWKKVMWTMVVIQSSTGKVVKVAGLQKGNASLK
jgi:hypothetical protein